MPTEDTTLPLTGQGLAASPWVAQHLAQQLVAFLTPLLVQLDACLDKRLVRTFLLTLAALIQWRNRPHGLLLSELGAYLLSPAQAPAGTKRLSNLLRSAKWSYAVLNQFLWQQAQARLNALTLNEEEALVVWDESVLEKPESLKLEGLGPVRSSKAARLKRIKPGYYTPPGGRPIFVPGMNWLGVLLLGHHGPPTLAAMHWWTTRGPRASDQRTQEATLLTQCAQAWGRRVLHIWDRGFAGGPWVGLAFQHDVRFILRWPKRLQLCTGQGVARPAGQITRGKRTRDHRLIWDARRRCWRKTGVLAAAVRHPEHDQPLWLVVARPGKGREPWYLLTNEEVPDAAAAWQIVFAYARRWQIEETWRYSKSELAMESPRLWAWERRLKLLLIASVAYAFLLSWLAPAVAEVRAWLLRHWCHRTGKRSRETPTPLYRLRSALSRLWLDYRPPPLAFVWQNPG